MTREVTFGKYRGKGKTVEQLMFVDPSYAIWLIENDVQGMGAYLKSLPKPIPNPSKIKAYCYGCTQDGRPTIKATRMSLYNSPTFGFNMASGAMYWCDECDPYRAGAESGRLVTVPIDWEYIRRVQRLQGTRGDLKDFARCILGACGVERATKAAIHALFER